MNVKLLSHTPLWVCSKAIRRCWASEAKSDTINTDDNIGEADRALIDRVGNKNNHSSTLEHLSYSYDIEGISRACLQELSRHRMASLSVKSTRYTLNELKKEEPFIEEGRWEYDRVTKYVVLTGTRSINDSIVESLERLSDEVGNGVPNDVVKYIIPEAYKTSLVWTINARSLQNFLKLRTSKQALPEIRMLAYYVYNRLPEEHKYLFKEYINE